MGKKLQKLEPGLSCKKDENRSCSSSRGLFNVFDIWQNCSSQRVRLVQGSDYPKNILKEKMESKKVGVDDGKRTVKALMNEERTKEEQKINLSDENKEAEAFINEALKKYLYKDRKNHRSRLFLDALAILKSNEELFIKLMQDPNSLFATHIRNLQELHEEKERSKLVVSKPKSSQEKQNMYNLVWGKIKKRYEYPSKLMKDPRTLGRVEISENVSCDCSSLHSLSSKKKKYLVEPSYLSSKTKPKSTNRDYKEDTSLDENICHRDYKGKDIDIVEEEAKRHLSMMLMNSSRNKCLPEKASPRMLGNILHLPQSRVFDLELDKLRNRLLDAKGHEGFTSMTDGIGSADQLKNVKSTDLSQSAKKSIDAAEDSECFGQVSPKQYERLMSLLDYSLLTPERVRKHKSGDSVRTDFSSPVSVLEPVLLDDLNSPPRTTSRSGNPKIQPTRIDFDEPSAMGSSTNLETNSENSMNEPELISTYIETLLHASTLSLDENPNSIDEIKLPLISFCDDNKLFSDIVNEAVSEVYLSYFKSSPFVSSKPAPTETSFVDEIKKRVDQYFHEQAFTSTIEQLAGEDHVRSRIWIDIRQDIQEITFLVGESIFEELVQDTIYEILV